MQSVLVGNSTLCVKTSSMTSLTSIIIGVLFVRATHSAGADANVNDDQPWNARSTGLQKLLNASPTLDNAPQTFLGNIQGSRWTNDTIRPHQFPYVPMNCQLGSNGLCVDDRALYLHKDQPVYADIRNHYEILEVRHINEHFTDMTVLQWNFPISL